MKNRFLALLMVFVLLLASCNGFNGKAADVYISEIMAKNNGLLADNNGEYPDWVELHNPTDKAINLKDYGMTDNAQKKGKFIFPDIAIEPGEYWVIFASGEEFVDVAKRVVHMPFSINSQTEDLFLYDAHGKELSHAEVRNLSDNTTCGMDENRKTVYYTIPTPGAKNSETYVPAKPRPGVAASDVKIRLNEYAPDSSVTVADEDGDFSAWVELYNDGETPLSLEGFALSDDPAKATKWLFPAVTVPAGGYQLVFLSGKAKTYKTGGELHASFVLTGKESTLLLFAGDGKKVDTCTVNELTSNLSCGRSAADTEKWLFYAKPTPGAANTTAGFASIDSARYPQNKTAVISEVASVNRTGITASNKQRYDYIELYNPTDKPVSLKGYRLSDKSNPKNWHTFPDFTIASGGYTLVFCGDLERYSAGTKEIFMTIGLNRYGDHLYLIDPDGIVTDDVKTGRLDDTQSAGRLSVKDPGMYYFEQTTPGAKNPETGLKGPAPTPVFSVPSGYLSGGQTVSITCPGTTIHYTTDGSMPTQGSPVYQEPLKIDRNITVRAKAYMQGRLPSDDSAGSYLVGRKHDMPLLFLSTDPANLYDNHTGILANGPGYTETFPHVGANFWKDWERPVHVEYVDENGQAQLEWNAGVKVFGQFSRSNPQKSLSINMRDKYGVKEVCYPFFGKDAATNVFSELVLRNAGQDNAGAHLRDALVAMAVKGQMDLDFMDYRPVVVYINGEYNGIYDLREKVQEEYVANRTGADPDQLDIIKGLNMPLSGTYAQHQELLEYVKTHNLAVQENYDHVASLVDIQELIHYWITVTFFGNTDTGNIKFYKSHEDGSRWRWILFDQDWALSPSTKDWNMMEEVINPKGHGIRNMFSTDLMRGLMKNKEFQAKFISTYGKHLKTTFTNDRLYGILDKMTAELRTEMPYHVEKWGTPVSVASWEKSCAVLRNFLTDRNVKIRRDIVETFSCTGVSAKGKYAKDFQLSVAQIQTLLDSEN